MGESIAPFGENVKKRSASKKIFELTTASPTDFFTYTSLLYVLSKVKVFTWWSNNTNEIQRIAISFLNCQLLDLGKTLSFVINQ
jgi:hypothetical protein